MALPLYLAMSAVEITSIAPLPPRIGYLGCHLSPSGPGLSGSPDILPPGAMLILDDSTSMDGHDLRLILRQMTEQVKKHRCSCVLLDFQRPGSTQAAKLAAELATALPCPVGVSELYAKELDSPVFLPPVPLDVPLKDYLSPWQGREVWLDVAPETQMLTLDSGGCCRTSLHPSKEPGLHRDGQLHCTYTIRTHTDRAEFILNRSPADVMEMLQEAENLGVTLSVGLWQELG